MQDDAFFANINVFGAERVRVTKRMKIKKKAEERNVFLFFCDSPASATIDDNIKEIVKINPFIHMVSFLKHYPIVMLPNNRFISLFYSSGFPIHFVHSKSATHLQTIH